MPSNPTPLDVDALMRAMNPSSEQPSAADVDAAFQRLVADLPVADPGPRSRARRVPRLRLALAGGLLAAATAVAFAVTNLSSGSSPSAGVDNAYAKAVVARAANVAAGTGGGVLHVDMVVTQTSADHSADVRYRVESWTQLAPPRSFWEAIHSGSDTTTTVVVGDHVETYDSATNTLSDATKQIAGTVPRAVMFDPAYHAVLSVLYPQEVGTATHLPRSFSALMARLIRSPHVRVQRHARLDGRSAVRITSLRGRAILYVQPRTYRPLEFVTTGDPGSSPSSLARIVLRFDAYGTLPSGAVSPPDLQLLHSRG